MLYLTFVGRILRKKSIQQFTFNCYLHLHDLGLSLGHKMQPHHRI